MAQVTASGPVNTGQLCEELGGIPIRVLHTDPPVVSADIDVSVLQAAVDAHVPDPEWQSPDPVPLPTASLEEQVAALTDALATLTADFLGGV